MMFLFKPKTDQEYEKAIIVVSWLLAISFFALILLFISGCVVLGGGSKAPPMSQLCPSCPEMSEQEQQRATWAKECGEVWEAEVAVKQGGELSEKMKKLLDAGEQQCLEKWKRIK